MQLRNGQSYWFEGLFDSVCQSVVHGPLLLCFNFDEEIKLEAAQKPTCRIPSAVPKSAYSEVPNRVPQPTSAPVTLARF
jgi:hypothetical protein